MSLLDHNSVDIVVRSPHIEGFDLIALDVGDIEDEVKRYNALIAKLSAYSHYVSSGQFCKDHPDAEGSAVRFCVLYKSPPNEAMMRVDAIKPRDNPSLRFSVIFQAQEDYFDRDTGKNAD